MDEEYIKAIHAAYGEDKLGSYDDFYSEITSNKDYRDLVYNQLGGADVFGEYTDFEDLVSIKQEDSQKKKTSQPYQPTSEEPTEVSKTDSESIDLGVYPTAFTPEEDIEAVKTSSKAKGYGLQDEEITKGRQAGFVLEKVDELSTKVSDWDLDAESNPDVFAFTSPTQEQVSAAEWGPTQFYQGAKGELGEPTVTEEERRKEYARNSRIAFGDDKYLFVQKELEQAKPELDKRYQELSGYDREEFIVEQPDGSLAIDPNALTEVQFFSDQFAQAHKEEVAKQEERYREKGRLGRGAGLVGQGFENLYYGVEGWFDPEDAAANTAFTGAKLEGAKRAMGLSEEEIQGGVIKNIGDGKVGSALTNLYAGVMSNIPQIAVGVASSYVGMPNVGMATLGASAGGAKYAQIYDNPNIPTSAKYLMAAQVVVTETLTERLAMGDINAAKAAIRGLSKAGRKELALRTAKNFIEEAKIPLRVGAEEAIEEGIAGGAEALMDNLVTGEPIDMYSIGDAMAIGFASGSGIGSAKVLTSMPSYVGSYKTANRRRKVLDSLTKLREAQNDPNVTQDEIDILQKSVDDAKLELVKIAAEDQQLYDKMSNEDVESIIKINRQIARGLDKLETISNDRAKSALKSQLQNLHKEKGNIEGKYRAEQAATQEAPVEGAENAVRTFAERIAKGEDVSSNEDIQFYENNKQEVEDALRQMQEAEEVGTETVEEQPTEMEGEAVVEEDLGFDIEDGDLGYHGGNLKYKAEGFGNVMKGTDVPFTGYYFYSSADDAKSRGNRQTGAKEFMAVDFSKYNLFKPKHSSEYFSVLSALKRLPITNNLDFLNEGYDKLLRKLRESQSYGAVSDDIVNLFETNRDNIIDAISQHSAVVDERLTRPKDNSDVVDTQETIALKALGFEGIDVRNIEVLMGDANPDSDYYGSVIFDLKEDSVISPKAKPKQETDAVQEQTAGEVPVQPEAEVSGEMEEGVPDTEPQEATKEGKKPRVAKDKKGITSLMERVFGLNKSKSKAAARIYDIAIGTIAERAGITKEEAYRRFGFVKGGKNTLKELASGGRALFQGSSGLSNFEKWKGDNELFYGSEVQDITSGKPVVVRVYHGTTNDFYEFDSSVKGNVEGHLGRVNYFTTDYQDASLNYQEEGADLTSRIDRRSEEIESTLQYEYSSDFGVDLDLVKRDFGVTDEEIDSLYPDGVPEIIEPNELSYFIAEKELKGGDSKVLDVFVKLNNPIVIGNGATWFSVFEISESDIEDAAKEIAEENDVSIEEAKEDYDYEIRDRAIENSGYENKVLLALQKALSDNGYSPSKAQDILSDSFYDEEVDLSKIESSLRKAELYENEDGEIASSQVISDFFKNLGYDGIILTDVSDRFNMGLSPTTSHVHVFDDFSNQIKLADGTNTTFGKTRDIRFQSANGKASGAMMMGMDAQAIIYALTDPNVSTPSHELAHVYEHYLTEQERADIEAWSGHKSGTVEFSEAFARGFEKYLADGKAPNDKLQKVFENFKKWLTEIYDGITGSEIDLELNDKMRGIYDAMLEGENKETARRRQRNTIKEKIDKSVVSKLPFLAKFNPEHSYTVAQAELIDKFIDEYVKTGSLKGSGNVEALINGVSNMASLKQKAKTGVRKIFFGNSFDAKALSLIREMSGKTFISKIFATGFEKVTSAIGMVELDEGLSDVKRDSSNWINKVKKDVDAADTSDVDSRGDVKMFAVGFVEQIYQRFSKDVGEERAIQLGIRMLELSIETQFNTKINREKINIQREALELIKNETTIEGILSKLTDGQRAVYEKVIEQNSQDVDKIEEISMSNGNPLERQNRYLHIPTITVDTGKNKLDLTPEEFSKDPNAIGYINPFNDKIFEITSGAQEARVKDINNLLKSFESGSVYLKPSFILEQHNSFFNTRLAIYTHKAIMQLNAALGAKEAREVFGGVENSGAENIDALKSIIKNNLNVNRISAYTLDVLPVVGNVFSSIKRNAIPFALGSVVQPLKQGTVIATTIVEVGDLVGRSEAKDLFVRSMTFVYDYGGEKIRSKKEADDFQFKNLPWGKLISKAPVSVRNTLDALEFRDQLRNITIISSFAPARTARGGFRKIRDYSLSKALVTPDRASAQVGWLNLYEAYMIKNGLLDTNIFYDKNGDFMSDAYRQWYIEQGNNPNNDAIAYASTRVLEYQGPSTEFERSMLQGNVNLNNEALNFIAKYTKDILLAMQSFSFGTSSTQTSAIVQLLGNNFTKEDKAKARVRLGGIAVSFALFNAIGLLVHDPLIAIAIEFIKDAREYFNLGDDEEEEYELNEKIKTLYKNPEDFRRALSRSLTNWTLESTVPFLSQGNAGKYALATGMDFIYYSIMNGIYGEEMKKTYGEFGSGGFTVWQQSSQMRPQAYKPKDGFDLGYYTILPEDAYELYKIFNAGVTGEYVDNYDNTYYLTEEQRKEALRIGGFMSFGYAVPAFPATTSKMGVDMFRGIVYEASDNYLATWSEDFKALPDDRKKELQEDFARNLNKYYQEQYKQILAEYGDEYISSLKVVNEVVYDLNDYSFTSQLKHLFAAMDGKEKASEGNIDAFLFNLSNRNITPIAKGNIINQRLKKFDDKKERNEYYGRFVYSGLFLYNMDELRAIMNHVAKLNEGGNDSK